jgi:hypothetical protein
MSASVTTGVVGVVVFVELPPLHPETPKTAAAPALAPTPARNLRRETPLLINVLKVVTIISLCFGVGFPHYSLLLKRSKGWIGFTAQKKNLLHLRKSASYHSTGRECSSRPQDLTDISAQCRERSEQYCSFMKGVIF